LDNALTEITYVEYGCEDIDPDRKTWQAFRNNDGRIVFCEVTLCTNVRITFLPRALKATQSL